MQPCLQAMLSNSSCYATSKVGSGHMQWECWCVHRDIDLLQTKGSCVRVGASVHVRIVTLWSVLCCVVMDAIVHTCGIVWYTVCPLVENRRCFFENGQSKQCTANANERRQRLSYFCWWRGGSIKYRKLRSWQVETAYGCPRLMICY